MRRGWTATLCVAAAIGLSAWLNVAESRAASDGVVLKLCYGNVDAPPWQYRRGGGLDFQLLDRAAKRAGVTFQYEAMPWSACQARLAANEVDGAFGEDSTIEASAAAGRFGRRNPDATDRLHATGDKPVYLLLSHEFSEQRPRLAERIRRSIAAARLSAAYQLLEHQTLALLGKT